MAARQRKRGTKRGALTSSAEAHAHNIIAQHSEEKKKEKERSVIHLKSCKSGFIVSCCCIVIFSLPKPQRHFAPILAKAGCTIWSDRQQHHASRFMFQIQYFFLFLLEFLCSFERTCIYTILGVFCIKPCEQHRSSKR